MTEDNHDLTELIERATLLRQQLAGRLPDRIYWGWKDFLVGTASMSAAAVGAYVLLLHWQLDKGSVPKEIDELLRIGRVQDTAAVRDEVLSKFREHAGRMYNVRALQEFIAAADAAVSARERGAAGGRSKAARNKDREPFPQ